MTLLLLSSLLFAQEEIYEMEIVDSTPIIQIGETTYDSNIDDLPLATTIPLYPTIEESVPSVSTSTTIAPPISSAVTDSKDPIFTSFDNALKIAKEENKIILLELISTNCHFCDRMKKEVLSQNSVQEAIKKDFVLAKVNVDFEPIPLGIPQQMTPMFVFITEQEDIEDMRLGFIDESSFLDLLEMESKKIK